MLEQFDRPEFAMNTAFQEQEGTCFLPERARHILCQIQLVGLKANHRKFPLGEADASSVGNMRKPDSGPL